MRPILPHRFPSSLFVHSVLATLATLLAAFFALPLPAAAATINAVTVPSAWSAQPSFGANVYVFTPSTPQSTIQATVDAVATTQVSNQFGTQRYAFLFEPGTYGSASQPAHISGGLLHHRRGPRPFSV